MEKFYTIEIAGLKRDLPICKAAEHLYIGAFVMFSDVELTVKAAEALLAKCPDFDVILTAESKGPGISLRTLSRPLQSRCTLRCLTQRCPQQFSQMP